MHIVEMLRPKEDAQIGQNIQTSFEAHNLGEDDSGILLEYSN